MSVNELSRYKLYLKAANVGIFSTSADIISMYILGEYTKLPLNEQLYISSGIGLFIGFIGQKLWIFQNKLTGWSLVRQIIGFLTWEILFIIIIANLVIKITEPINEKIRYMDVDTVKNSNILSLVLHIETDHGREHVELDTLTDLAIKHICIFILFTFISLPIYKRLFKY